MGFEDRIRELRTQMEREDLDLTMVLAGPNMIYLSGYTAISLERLITLLVFRDYPDAYLIIPKLETERAESNVKITDVNIISYNDDEDPIAKLADILIEKRIKKIGVEGNIPYRYVDGILRHVEDINVEIVDPIVTRLRIIKRPDEVSLLKKAAEINMNALIEAIFNIEEDITEKDLMNRIKNISLDLGADSTPFTIVQSGPNSSKPHEEPSDRRIRRGNIVLFDIGASYQGYISDITRTVVFGDPSKIQMEIFRIVLDAQLTALSRIKPGVEAAAVDEAARRVIESAGYGEYFIHRTGHGIGLEVHEEPYIKPGNSDKLIEGMAFTVEPGIYLPGKFGVRIEDNVVVTSDGCLNLTTLPKSLFIKDYEDSKT